MSLPVRRPPSQPQLPSLHHKQSPSGSYTDKSTATSPRQTPKVFTTSTMTANMPQTVPSSSPLSSPLSSLQEAVTPRASSPPTHLSSETPTKSGSPALENNVTPISTPVVETTALLQPSVTTTSNMSKKRAQQPTKKRDREDDEEEDSPPSKKVLSPPKLPARGEATSKKSAAKVAAPPRPSTRPSRNRKAPERFEDLQEAKPVKVASAKRASANSKVFDPIFVTTNSTSRLGKADVYHMLLEPAAWTSLSAEQQITLLSMLPQDPATMELIDKVKRGETEGTRPHAFNVSNDCFRTDVAKFKEDLKNGHLAKTWQASAEQAIIERAAGDYDAWKADESERWWGQKASA